MTWEYSTIRLRLGSIFREGEICAELGKMDEDMNQLKGTQIHMDVREHGTFKIYRTNECDQNVWIMYWRTCSGRQPSRSCWGQNQAQSWDFIMQ